MPKQQSVGKFTFAYIDTDDDSWRWAIVTDYEDSQTYGFVICAFCNAPNELVITRILEMLHYEYDTGSCKIEDMVPTDF